MKGWKRLLQSIMDARVKKKKKNSKKKKMIKKN